MDYAPLPLPFGIEAEIGCSKGRGVSYIRGCAALVVIGLLFDFFGTLLTGLGLRSTDPNKKYKYYRVAIYALVVALIALTLAAIIYPVQFSKDLANEPPKNGEVLEPETYNGDNDFDNDGIENAVDDDDDNDGILDEDDPDDDNDGTPDEDDADDDNDGVLDEDDDNDGIDDDEDEDDDNDGIADIIDSDDDNDGVPDCAEDGNDDSCEDENDDEDQDNDGIDDDEDEDDDNDGIDDDE